MPSFNIKDPFVGQNTTTTAPPDPSKDTLEGRLDAIMKIIGSGGTTDPSQLQGVEAAAAPAASPTIAPMGHLSAGSAHPVEGALAPSAIYQAALSAGFNSQQAVIMTAIALAESSGRPSAHNDNRATGDNSYGLWQINMIDNLGPARQQQFGLSSYDDLFDPNVNAKAAFQVSGGGANFGPWTTYKSGAYKNYLGQAQAAAQAG